MMTPVSGPREVSVDVRRLYANVYLLTTPQGRLLVDSGSQWHSSLFARLLRQFQPDALLLTHAHLDHSGGAGVAARLGVPIYAHPLERPALTGEVHDLPYPAGQPALGRAVSRLHRKLPHTAVTDIHPGDLLLGWQIEALPGHTAGQIGAVRDGVLIAADAVLAGRDGAHLPRMAYNADHAQALATLKRMAAMDLRAVLPGHGRALTMEEVRARAGRDDQAMAGRADYGSVKGDPSVTFGDSSP